MEYNNDSEMWDLQGEGYSLQDDSVLDASKSLWNSVSHNEGDFSCMLDETTPLKACGDLTYSVAPIEYTNKELEQFKETSSQIKRRRMLQFDSEAFDVPVCNQEISMAFLKSKETMGSYEETLSEVSQWVSGFADTSGSGFECPEQSSEGWLADCLGDADMNFTPDDMNLSGSSDVLIDITEICDDIPSRNEVPAPQERPARARRNVVFKGKKSNMRAPSKPASSVVYPFAFVKPCGVHGDVTLKDINQRISTPPPSKSKQACEDASPSYPTSALTGKPVVGKTKIRTEGGKGSITIMRTIG